MLDQFVISFINIYDIYICLLRKKIVNLYEIIDDFRCEYVVVSVKLLLSPV